MRSKLVLPKSIQKKLENSAYFNGVSFVDGETMVTGDELHTVLECKDVQNLVNTFLKLNTYEGTEMEAHKSHLKKKADEKAKAEAEKAKAAKK